MKKLVKILLWVLGIIVAIVLVLPLWVGPVVKTAANVVVPKKTGTAFNLGAFALNPYTGKLAVGDMQLWNPDGFSEEMAVTLGSLSVDVDMASLAGDPIVVREIVLKDVFVSYVMNARGESNFAIIKKNATDGEGKAKAEGQEEVKVKGEQRTDSSSSQTPQSSQPSQQSQPSKKVIIDHLLIANVKVQVGPLTTPMPNIELTGIGRKSGGVTMKEAWEQIYVQLRQNFSALGVNLDGLVSGIGNAGVEQAMKAINAAGDLSKKEGRQKAVKNLVDAFVGGIDAAGSATSQSKDAVNEQTDKAVNALKGLFK